MSLKPKPSAHRFGVTRYFVLMIADLLRVPAQVTGHAGVRRSGVVQTRAPRIEDLRMALSRLKSFDGRAPLSPGWWHGAVAGTNEVPKAPLRTQLLQSLYDLLNAVDLSVPGKGPFSHIYMEVEEARLDYHRLDKPSSEATRAYTTLLAEWIDVLDGWQKGASAARAYTAAAFLQEELQGKLPVTSLLLTLYASDLLLELAGLDIAEHASCRDGAIPVLERSLEHVLALRLPDGTSQFPSLLLRVQCNILIAVGLSYPYTKRFAHSVLVKLWTLYDIPTTIEVANRRHDAGVGPRNWAINSLTMRNLIELAMYVHANNPKNRDALQQQWSSFTTALITNNDRLRDINHEPAWWLCPAIGKDPELGPYRMWRSTQCG